MAAAGGAGGVPGQEEGMSRWQLKKEAKRNMYLNSTERGQVVVRRRDKDAKGDQQCQKCLQRGHWTYECKNPRKAVSRPSASERLRNPRLRAPLAMDKGPDVPSSSFLNRTAPKRKRSGSVSSSSSSSSSLSSTSGSSTSSSSSGLSSSSSSSSGSGSSDSSSGLSSGSNSSSLSSSSSSSRGASRGRSRSPSLDSRTSFNNSRRKRGKTDNGVS